MRKSDKHSFKMVNLLNDAVKQVDQWVTLALGKTYIKTIGLKIITHARDTSSFNSNVKLQINFKSFRGKKWFHSIKSDRVSSRILEINYIKH